MELICVPKMRLLRNVGENHRHLHRTCVETVSYKEYFYCQTARLISSSQVRVHPTEELEQSHATPKSSQPDFYFIFTLFLTDSVLSKYL